MVANEVNELPCAFRVRKVVAAMCMAGMMSSPLVYAQDNTNAQNIEEEDVENIVVTGVFSAKSLEQAPVALSVVSGEELEQQIPSSASDILKNGPGVFVNSALGEIRNVVFSRGVSANSLDGASGYYYVSMQENSVPVELMTTTNYGPDYFSRPDLMLDHVESLRGGTASVTGANAPGGVFNYIMRTGKSFDKTQIQARYGLEGDNNPYKRLDFYTGGELSEDTYYALGGFYRKAEGARHPGYDLNYGGQIRANILHEYDGGRVQVNAKYLNDHNGWFEFIPSTNFSDPRPATGFSTTSSVLPPANPHSYTNPDGSTGSWDGSDLIHSKEKSVNVSWNHDLPNDFSLNTWLGYAQKSTEWNTGAVISPMNLTDMFAGILPGSFGLPGETIYSYQDSGAEAARVASATGFDRTVVSSNLPSPTLFDGAGVFTQFAMYQLYETDEVFFKSVLNKEAGDHSLAFGIELSKGDIENTGGSGGAGVATLEEQPLMLDITHILPDGTELIVTDPAGFGAHANAFSSGVKYEGSQKQLSLFVGDTWYVNDAITIDAAVRYEKINYDAVNTAVNRNVPATAYNGGGGADGNPATLYDNQANETLELNVERDYDYFAYTGSVTYQWSPDVTTYVRYANSKKAPDMGSVVLLDTPFRVENEFAQPQKIEQLEIGIKYLTDDWNIALFPFYSGLTNVGAIQQFTDEFGRNYLTPTRFGEVTTYGVEADVDWEITSTLRVRSALTLQTAEASGFGVWAPNDPGADDDVYTVGPDTDADNVPNVMFRGTITWDASDNIQTYLTSSYMGDRPANRQGAWDLPAYWMFDAGVTWNVNDNWKVQGQIRNLFDEAGVMSWAAPGGFLASLDRQSVSQESIAANPNAIFGVAYDQPRSYWVTATYTF